MRMPSYAAGPTFASINFGLHRAEGSCSSRMPAVTPMTRTSGDRRWPRDTGMTGRCNTPPAEENGSQWVLPHGVGRIGPGPGSRVRKRTEKEKTRTQKGAGRKIFGTSGSSQGSALHRGEGSETRAARLGLGLLKASRRVLSRRSTFSNEPVARGRELALLLTTLRPACLVHSVTVL